MNCDLCGTELPLGAMFCGECGRAVGVRVAATHPDSGMPMAQSAVAPVSVAEPFVPPRPGDTRIIEPLDLDLAGVVRTDEAAPGDEATRSAPDADIEQDLPPEIVAAEDAAPASGPEPAPASVPVSVPVSVQEAPLASTPAPMRRPDPFPWGDPGGSSFSDADEVEQTLIVPRREGGERFVLQFSTGESVTVFGTGLLGRNPLPQPGEYFDQLVAITDPGKSVSKTHLEFGQDSGAFWVSDRYSGNGSVVREPEMPARRLDPGKRYRIVRGSRVDIGEQFFVVS